jgi:hypothetical protein
MKRIGLFALLLFGCPDPGPPGPNPPQVWEALDGAETRIKLIPVEPPGF